MAPGDKAKNLVQQTVGKAEEASAPAAFRLTGTPGCKQHRCHVTRIP